MSKYMKIVKATGGTGSRVVVTCETTLSSVSCEQIAGIAQTSELVSVTKPNLSLFYLLTMLLDGDFQFLSARSLYMLHILQLLLFEGVA